MLRQVLTTIAITGAMAMTFALSSSARPISTIWRCATLREEIGAEGSIVLSISERACAARLSCSRRGTKRPPRRGSG